MKKNLKSTVDPCEDFYSFACGNFQEHNKLPGHRSSYASSDKVDEDVNELLIKQLNAESQEDEIEPIKFIRQLYKKCTNSSLLAKNELRQLAPLEDEIRSGENIESLIVITAQNSVTSLVELGIINDPDETSKRAVMIDSPSFTVGEKDLIANESDSKAREIRQAYLNYISASFKLYEFEKNTSDAEERAKKILQLEVELAKLTTKDQKAKESKLLEKYDKAKLSQLIRGVNLAQVVDTILGNKTVDSLIVLEIEYLKGLQSVIEGKMSVVKDFLVWKMIEKYGSVVSDKLHEENFKFLKVKDGLTAKPDPREDVLTWIAEKMPNVLGRLYIDAADFSKEDKQKVQSVIGKLKHSMGKMIDENAWMDEATRKVARDKLDKMKFNVGYPEWIRNDTRLIKWMDIKLNEESGAFDLVLKLEKFLVADAIKKLHEKANPEAEWGMSAASVNGVYDLLQNSITLPAAILSGLFFDSSCPDFFNFGAIGTVIGHEIVHAFDNNGRKHGTDGHSVNWWSNETLKNFQDISAQLISQYSSIVDERTDLNLDGKNTLGENIADNGAIRASFQAYFEHRVEPPEQLKGFEDWSEEKMFFLSHANAWCSVSTDENLRNTIFYDEHSPPQYRINVPLSNFDHFARAFKCKSGSKMNPVNKIKVF